MRPLVVALVLVAALPVSTAAARSEAGTTTGDPPTFEAGAARPRELSTAPAIGVTLNAVPDSGRDIAFTGCLVGAGCSPFSLDDDDDPTLPRTVSTEALTPGTYTVTADTTPAGSTLAISCSSGASVDLGARRVTVTLDGNEAVNCTFTITEVSLRIRHTTTPTENAQAFDYTGCLGSGCAAFTLDGTSAAPHPNQAIAAVAPGTYTITQAPVAGWTVAGITCTGATASTVDLPNRRVTVAVGSVDSVSCVFDVRRPSLSVDLDSLPSDAQDVTFTGCRVGGGCSDFVLDDDGDPAHPEVMTSADLVPGTYTVTMAAVPGWDLQSISCFGNGATTTSVPDRRVRIELGPTSNARCFFTTRTTGITIVQSTVGNDPQDFSFSGCAGSSCAPFTLDGDPSSTAPPSSVRSTGVAPGTYTVTQDAVGAYPLDSITCSTPEAVDLAQRRVTITLVALEHVVCTFDNGSPRLTLAQDTVPDSPQDVGFVTCHLGTGCGQLTLDDDADPTLANRATASDVASGTYHLTQPYVPGLTRPTVSCTGEGEQPVADGVTVALTRSRTCTFTNHPAGPALNGAAQVTVTERLGCARTTAAGVRCWGSAGPGGDSLAGPLTDVADAPITDAAEVAVNGGYATGTFGCYRTTGGEARCWGSNAFGQLGDNTDLRHDHPAPVLAPGGAGALAQVAQLSVGTVHACAVLTNGQARCWGHNGFGQLGDGTTTTRYRPVTVSNTAGTGPLTDVARISAGDSSTCAVLTDGQVRCWGSGQLGDGTAGTATLPRVVSDPAGDDPLTGAIDVSVAASPATSVASVRACAVLQSGGAVCWGATPRPVPVVGDSGTGELDDVVEVSVGPEHTCARLADGQARCWGGQAGGQLGNGVVASSSVATPQVVLGADGTSPITGLTSIDSGWDATCAAAGDGQAWCWGRSLYDALGIGTTAPWPFAVAVLSRP